MANPPITIPPFNNVPAPGSPIRSDWPQQITTYAIGKVAKTGDTMTGQLTATALVTTVGNVTSAAAVAAGTNVVAPNGNIVAGQDPNAALGAVGVRSQSSGIEQAYTTTAGVASLWLTRMGTAANTGEVLARFGRTSADTVCGTIAITGATSVAYNTTSDPRLKVNDGPITDAADRVLALARRAFRGRWRDTDDETGELLGPTGEPWDLLSSHDIEDVAPYAVTGERAAVDDNGNIVPQQANYPALVPLLIAALGDALERIEHLEAQP